MMKFVAARPLVFALLTSLTVLLLREVVSGADAPAKQESARLQYARAYVSLTKLELKIAETRNEQAPNTFPKAVLLGMKEHIAVSETWLHEAEQREAGQPYNVALATAVIESKIADEQYAYAQKLNGLVGIPPQQLELLRIKADLAHLRVATAKEIDLSSPIGLVQYQLERMREEIGELTAQGVHVGDVD